MEASARKIEESLAPYGVFGIDTMVFIYHFEDNPVFTVFTRPLFQRLESGRATGVTSTLSLMEILTKPKREGRDEVVRDYKYALANFPNLKVRDMDWEVAERGAEIRAKYRMRPPDAIQVGTSLVEGADALITNDVGLKEVEEIRIIVMKEILEVPRMGNDYRRQLP